MTLSPNYGGFDAAILSVTNTSFTNNFTVTGRTGNDGDVYIMNGNLVVTNSPDGLRQRLRPQRISVDVQQQPASSATSGR